jgi:hypothetical protein
MAARRLASSFALALLAAFERLVTFDYKRRKDPIS